LKQTGKIGGTVSGLVGRKVGGAIQGSQAFRKVGEKVTQVPVLSEVLTGKYLLDLIKNLMLNTWLLDQYLQREGGLIMKTKP